MDEDFTHILFRYQKMATDVFELKYPDVVAVCQRESCSDEFWETYIARHYGIEEYRNPRNVPVSPREIASIAYQLLEYIFSRQAYPTANFIPTFFRFIYEPHVINPHNVITTFEKLFVIRAHGHVFPRPMPDFISAMDLLNYLEIYQPEMIPQLIESVIEIPFSTMENIRYRGIRPMTIPWDQMIRHSTEYLTPHGSRIFDFNVDILKFLTSTYLEPAISRSPMTRQIIQLGYAMSNYYYVKLNHGLKSV